MSVPMNSVQFKQITAPILNVAFDGLYDQRKDEYKEIFSLEDSKYPRRYQEEPVLFGFGAAPEIPDGQAVTYTQGGTLYTKRYVFKRYGYGFALTVTLVEDGDHISVGETYSKHLAQSMIETDEIDAANILNRAFSSSYTGGDGVSLINSAHPMRTGTYSNQLATSAPLSQTSLEAMVTQIMSATDDTNKKIRLRPQKLVVPTSVALSATVLLRSVLRAGTANNDINPINSMTMFGNDPVVISRLTSNTAWYVSTDAPDGLKFITRTALKKGMEGDFDTDSMRYKSTKRRDVGWTNPRGVYATPGT
jgi:hypothetical protein